MEHKRSSLFKFTTENWSSFFIIYSCLFHWIYILETHEISYAMEDKPDEDKEKERHKYENDWKRVANVLDRCFFWAVFVAIIVSLIVFLHPLMGEI